MGAVGLSVIRPSACPHVDTSCVHIAGLRRPRLDILSRWAFPFRTGELWRLIAHIRARYSHTQTSMAALSPGFRYRLVAQTGCEPGSQLVLRYFSISGFSPKIQ